MPSIRVLTLICCLLLALVPMRVEASKLNHDAIKLKALPIEERYRDYY